MYTFYMSSARWKWEFRYDFVVIKTNNKIPLRRNMNLQIKFWNIIIILQKKVIRLKFLLIKLLHGTESYGRKLLFYTNNYYLKLVIKSILKQCHIFPSIKTKIFVLFNFGI